METKNAIIRNFSISISDTAGEIQVTADRLVDTEEVNAALVKTLNVLLEAMRSNIVLLQQEIDKYS